MLDQFHYSPLNELPAYFVFWSGGNLVACLPMRFLGLAFGAKLEREIHRQLWELKNVKVKGK